MISSGGRSVLKRPVLGIVGAATVAVAVIALLTLNILAGGGRGPATVRSGRRRRCRLRRLRLFVSMPWSTFWPARRFWAWLRARSGDRWFMAAAIGFLTAAAPVWLFFVLEKGGVAQSLLPAAIMGLLDAVETGRSTAVKARRADSVGAEVIRSDVAVLATRVGRLCATMCVEPGHSLDWRGTYE